MWGRSFLDTLKWQLSSRAEFDRLKSVDPNALTDLERAARFLYLQRLSFGGKSYSQSFGIDSDGPARFDLTKLVPMLEDVHDRLSGVVIECLDYKELLQRYDKSQTLFYLDPPYYGCEKDYGPNLFDRDQFEIMATILAEIKGAFVLSLNDVEDVRRIFQGFHIRTVETRYSVQSEGSNKKVSEVLISNTETVLKHEQNRLI